MVNQPLRILYVDDSALDRELVRDALTREKPGEYLLTEAGSRREFEARMAPGKYDLVLSDFNILGFDGLQVLDRVRQVDPSLPIIIVTGTGNEEVAVEAMKRGAGDYVIKTPSHIRHLPYTIREVLVKRYLEIEGQRDVEALRQAHEQMEAIVQEAPLAVVTLDLQGNILTWNPTAEQLIGWSGIDAIGKPFPLASQGQTSEFNAILKQSLSGERLKSQEIRRQRRDGSWFDLALHTAPLHDQSGNVSGLLVMMEDITERKRNEQAIKDSENRFRCVIEQSSDGIVLMDGHGKILKWNRAQEQITGQNRLDVLGKPIWDVEFQLTRNELRTPDRYEALKKGILDSFELRKTARFQDNIQEICRLDGDFRMVESKIFPIRLDDGVIFGSVSRDITEQIEAEKILSASEEKFRCLVEQSNEGVVLTDEQGCITEWNNSEEQIIGILKGEALGTPIWDLIYRLTSEMKPDPAWYTFLKNGLQEMLRTGQIPWLDRTLEFDLAHQNGALRSIELLAYSVRTNKGNLIGGIFRDITERKQAEQKIRDLARFPDENPNPVLRIRADGVILYANQVCEPLLSFWHCRVGEPMQPEYRKYIQDIFEHGKNLEIEISCEDQTYLLILVPISESGYINGYAKEITNRKQAEDQLRESEAKYRTLVENIPQKIFAKDRNSVYLSCNGSMAQDLGFSPDEIAGRTDYDLYPKEIAERYVADDRRIMGTGKLEVIEEKYQKEGQVYWGLTYKTPIREKDGTITGILGINHDITVSKQAEQALRESEMKYRILVENIPERIFMKDRNSAYLSCNNNLAADFGISPDEILGRTDYDFSPKELADKYRADDRRIMESGKTEIIEEKHGGAGGEIWIQTIKTPIRDKDGAITGVLGIFHDISVRKQTEEALKREQRLIQTLMEHIPDTIYFKDEKSRFIRVNKAWADKLHLSDTATAIGKTDFDFFRKKHAQEAYVIEQEIIRSGKAILNLEEKETYPDRPPTWVSTIKMPLLDDNGKIIGTFGVSRDITKRKQAEEALVQHQEHLEELVKERTAKLIDSEAKIRKHSEEISDLYNNAPCGYHSIGDDGTFLSINDTELNWLGYNRDEIIGKKKLSDVLSPKYLDKFQREFVEFMQLGSIHDIEVDLIRKDGTLLPVLINATAVKDADGNFMMSRETLIDNSQRLRANKAMLEGKEAAESANRAKSIFLANMSHEIRTPMNAILGFTELMLTDPGFSPFHRQHLEIIHRSGKHLLELINDILEMSKIEAGHISLNPTPVDLIGIIYDLEMMFRARIAEKSLDFKVIVQEDLPHFIEADENKLRQIFINLLGNAVKFTDHGSVTWRTRAEKSLDGKLRLISEVEDTGPGIAPEEIGKLFQAFQQTASGERQGSGTGLGLAISAKFAQLMGGEIKVSSEVGKGSTFRFDLEIQEARNEDIIAFEPPRRVVRLSPTEPAYRILVVDDNLDNRLLAMEQLRLVGFLINEAANGKEAAQVFLEWRPNLILMDMHMPVMDGYEAIRQIKSTEEGRQLPIIALTANAFKEDEKKALDTGADGYLRKPFRDVELFAAIKNLLGVQYEYEEEINPPQTEKVPKDRSISEKLLADIPGELIESIRLATLTANLTALLDLIDQLQQPSPQLANQLRQLAINYQYDRLLALLPEKKVRK